MRAVAIASTSLRRLRARRSASWPLGEDVRAVLVQALDQLVDALAVVGLGLDDRHAPALAHLLGRAVEVGQREHAADLAHHRVGQRMVGLVDHDHVRDLHHARLQRLDRVARAGHQHEHDRVGVVDDVDLGLTDADGLDEHVLAAGRVEQQRRLQRGLGEPAERAAVGHRADEHALVEEVLGEADAVAQQRALGERRGGVDRQHADAAPRFAARLRERADQRRLADAGRPGEADDGGLARVGIDLLDQLPALRAVVLDERDRARQRAAVAVEQALRECGIELRVGHRGRNHRRAIRFPCDGAARRRTRDRDAPRRSPTRCGARPRRCTAGRSRCCASCAPTTCSTAHYARLLVALAAAEAALPRRLQTDGLCFICPRVKLEIGRDATLRDRPLGVDRARLQDPRARGRGGDRREDRDGPGVHDLGLPARLDRPRVHPRRPRDADRLRPRRHRGRAPDPRCRGSTSATCASATTSGSATARACCAASASATTASSAPARW